MFEKLVESIDPHSKPSTRNQLVAICAFAIVTLFVSALVTSLFNNALAMDDLSESARLVTPQIEIAEVPIPKSNPETKASVTSDKLSTRKNIVLRIEDAPTKAPASVSTVPSDLKVRPIGPVAISDRDYDARVSAGNNRGTESTGGFVLTSETNSGGTEVAEEDKKVPAPPKLDPPPDKPSYIGVVNGKAVYLDIPSYPAAARQMNVKGQVKVQVLIDEDGNVVSANVIEGHGLLKSVSTSAAKRSRFSPTFLNRKKVQVRGIIIYNFQ